MKALVFGADGFMGKKMCLYLRKLGKEVKAFDISDMEDLRNDAGIECIQGNFQMIDSMPTLFDDVDEVYHFICTSIPQVGTKQIPQEIEINLIPLTRMLQIMHERNIEKFLFVSSGGTVYGNGDEKSIGDKLEPICSYGALKQVSESYISLYNRIYGHHYNIARVSNPYGLGQHKYKTQGIIPIFINALLNNKPITVFGDGENIRDYIYVEDVIEALHIVCNYDKTDDAIFNIGSGESYSINQIIDIIEEELDQKFTAINHVDARSCDVDKNILNVVDSSNKLEWSPKTKLRDGIKKTYEKLK